MARSAPRDAHAERDIRGTVLNFDRELGDALSYARVCFGSSVAILR
jgi:hypothetical protein